MPEFEHQAGAAKAHPGIVEFVAMMALVSSLVALSIDAMLPAFPQMAQDLAVERSNDIQLVVSALILGMIGGQLFYGPWSDSAGRKTAMFAGFILFIIGSILSAVASNFEVMLVGRFLQGLGAAGPRTVAVALIRDQFEGRDMARVMSFMMSVFILVPIVAPALGQGIVMVSHWRMIYVVFAVLAIVVMSWVAIRQPETLPADRRQPFSLKCTLRAAREVFSHRITFSYTIVSGLVAGSFYGYLNSAQQIFVELYGLGDRFPIYFGALAFFFGLATVLNGRFVMQFGMRMIMFRAIVALAVLSVFATAVAVALSGMPPLWFFLGSMAGCFFFVGLLFGNMNAMAMQPLGHIAGTASAVIGALSNLIAVALGALIGQAYNHSIVPLIGGFAMLAVVSAIVMYWVHQVEPDVA